MVMNSSSCSLLNLLYIPPAICFLAFRYIIRRASTLSCIYANILPTYASCLDMDMQKVHYVWGMRMRVEKVVI